jgi:hypothetical protein
MKPLLCSGSGLALALALLLASAAACSASPVPDDDVLAGQSALRPMTESELLGELIYGETKDIDYTPAPKYRAFAFEGKENDQIQAQVVSRDATDPVLWVTDDAWNVIAMNNDVKVTDANAQVMRFLPRTGKYYLVFREMNAAPRAKFSVSVRKLGALPFDCDPDGEGIFNPDCTDPLDVDPFDPSSCEGPTLSATGAASAFGVEGGLRLSSSKIYYRTRQCKATNGAPDCSPWVRAWGMDVKLTTIGSSGPELPDRWAITADTTRKVKVDFSLFDDTRTYCVDGPFTSLHGEGWTPFADGTPGICAATSASVAAKVSASCARFEPPPVRLRSGNPGYFTEFSAVLLARY